MPKRPNPTVVDEPTIWGWVVLVGYVVIAVGFGLAYLLGVR